MPKTKHADPPRPIRFTVILSAAESKRLAKLADERGVSRGEVLRGALSTVPTTTRTA